MVDKKLLREVVQFEIAIEFWSAFSHQLIAER